MMSSKRKPTEESYLTEAILIVQHEVQSALDYISEISSKEGTELGKSSALMNIERLRLKLPIRIKLEEGRKKITIRPTPLTIDEIRKNLARRTGFIIDKGLPGKLGVFGKVKVSFEPNAEVKLSEGSKKQEKWLEGEIEIAFVPLKRE